MKYKAYFKGISISKLRGVVRFILFEG